MTTTTGLPAPSAVRNGTGNVTIGMPAARLPAPQPLRRAAALPGRRDLLSPLVVAAAGLAGFAQLAGSAHLADYARLAGHAQLAGHARQIARYAQLASGQSSGWHAVGVVLLTVLVARLAWLLGRPAGAARVRASYVILPAVLVTVLLLVLGATASPLWLAPAAGMAALAGRAAAISRR